MQRVETNVTVNRKRKVMNVQITFLLSIHSLSQVSLPDQESKAVIIPVSITHHLLAFKSKLSLISPTENTSLGIYLSHHSVIKTKRWHHSLIYYLH